MPETNMQPCCVCLAVQQELIAVLFMMMQDGIAMLWDLTDAKRLYTLEASDIIHALCFSPNRYWLCAATQSCIKVRSPITAPF